MILLAAVLVIQAKSESALHRVILNPTGVNGYEEYVRAAIVAEELQANEYRYYVQSTTVSSLPPKKPEWLPKATDKLQEDGLAVERFKGVLRLVRAGNRKPVWYPNQEPNSGTLFPEVSYLRTFPRLFAVASNWEMANGNVSLGGDNICEALVLCIKMPTDIRLQWLMRKAAIRVVTNHIFKVIPRLSQWDCDNLADKIWQLVDSKNVIINGYLNDQRVTVRTVQSGLQDPSTWLQGDKDLVYLSKQLTKEDASMVLRFIEAEAVQADKPLLDVLSRPESEWSADAQAPTDVDFDSVCVGATAHAKEVALRIAKLIGIIDPSASASDFPSMYATDRAQMRLMALHLKIASYRWEYMHLPDRITDAVDELSATDPLTGGYFVYHRKGDTYELYSEGLKGKGRIDVEHPWKSAYGDRPEIIP